MITGVHHISMKCGTKEELERVRDFYLKILGFSIKREWPEGIMIDVLMVLRKQYVEVYTLV